MGCQGSNPGQKCSKQAGNPLDQLSGSWCSVSMRLLSYFVSKGTEGQKDDDRMYSLSHTGQNKLLPFFLQHPIPTHSCSKTTDKMQTAFHEVNT